MKIRCAKIFIVEIPYKSHYKTSTNITPVGRHVVVRLECEDGTVGWGETGIISRRYPAQGDSPESIFCILKEYLCPFIIGENPLQPEVIMSKLDILIRGHYFAKCAIDHALLDLQGKILDVSVSILLGGAYHYRYPVSRSLPLASPDEVAHRASILRDQGYTRLTLKGAGNKKQDFLCFQAVRKILGSDFELEIDPNGAYDAPTAIQFLNMLEELGVYAVEQPTPGDDIRALAEVKSKINIPVIADESIFTKKDLRDIVDHDAANVVCLKPFKSGGILASRKLQVVAECFGLGVSIGSMHPFGIGTAALHHFAAGIPNLVTAGYGSPYERFIDDITDETCYDFKDGVVTISTDRAGLGVVVNEKKLKKYSSASTLIENYK